MNSSSEIASTMPEVNRLISSSRRCSSCGHQLDCDKPEEGMVGLPAGLRFDPTDQELIEHLEAKVKEGGSRAHPLIDEFIHTIQGEDGICYTHPEKLPGVTRDGLSKHFFHRSAKAYTTSTRKRRKIQAEPTDLPSSRNGVNTRWHKTGKTRPVMVRGQQKGCKKILVLYTDFGKQRKSEKTSWVMHEYHLGELEGEKEGELLLSKIFYQTQTRNAAIHATVDQHATATRYTVESMPGAIQNGLTGCIDPAAAAAAAMKVQRQQQQLLKQADGQLISSASTKKMFHEEEQHRLQKLDHRSAGLQKLIAACQSGTSIHQPKEAQCPYQLCWPPDSQDQHG